MASIKAAHKSNSFPDKSLRNMHNLEGEIKKLNEQLIRLSVSNAANVLLISHINQIATLTHSDCQDLRQIQRLIHQHTKKVTTEMTLNKPSEKGILTPPATSPESTSPGTFSTADAASGYESGVSDVKSNIHFDDDDKMQGPGKKTEPNSGGPTNLIDADKSGHDNTDGEETSEIWHEFSLEEELEGITDAPAADRAAMRVALQAKEEEHRRRLHESACHKRRIAEMEGRRFKMARQKPAAQPLDMPQEPDKRCGEIDPQVMQPATEEDDDGYETSSTSGIISFGASSPKNADRFGIMFEPPKMDAPLANKVSQSHGSPNARRSVLIRHIPCDVNIHQVLACIRGGTIVTARLLPETLSIGAGQTTLITFSKGEEAEYCSRTAGQYFATISGPDGRVEVSLLGTASYPTRESLDIGDVASSLGVTCVTRCLIIDNFPNRYVNELCLELRLDIRRFPMRVQALEEMWFEGETLHINFTSIQEAVKAHHVAKFFYYGKFSAGIRFGADPCASIISSGVGIQSASHGCAGLKTLIETVGLAGYSRTHGSDHHVDTNGKEVMHTTSHMSLSAATSCAGAQLVDLVDLSIGTASENGGKMQSGTPWTQELMMGLDLL